MMIKIDSDMCFGFAKTCLKLLLITMVRVITPIVVMSNIKLDWRYYHRIRHTLKIETGLGRTSSVARLQHASDKLD